MNVEMHLDPLSCEEAELLVSERVDGETLSSASSARLDEHLKRCRRCHEVLRLESERSVLLARALAPDEEGSRQLSRTIVEEAKAMEARGKTAVFRRPLLARWASGAALAATGLVALGLWWLLVPGPPEVPHVAPPGSTPVHPAGEIRLSTATEHPGIIPASDGAPLRRRVRRDTWILRGPLPAAEAARGSRARRGALELDIQRVNYRRLPEWPYR